jgi:Fe-S-cluster containining protein
VSEEDVVRIANFLRLPVSEFEARYVVRRKYAVRLKKPKGSQCHFLGESGCSIHAVKPVQCRLFPFWPELVEHRENWQAAAQNCPGIGRGDLIQIGAALEAANEMRTAYPVHYSDP